MLCNSMPEPYHSVVEMVRPALERGKVEIAREEDGEGERVWQDRSAAGCTDSL